MNILFIISDATELEKVKFDYSKDLVSGSAATSSGSNKRAKNKKRREAQQEFTHSWLRGALKGHTASVLNMNFSSNGKYLASCAEGIYQYQYILKKIRPARGHYRSLSYC